MANIEISEHAEERMKERLGLQRKSCLRMAKKVYEKGLSLEDSKGNLQYYMKQKLRNATKTNRILKIYGTNCYIFAKDKKKNELVLVTVFSMPKDIIKSMNKKEREIIL